ncbi:MAG: CCA tRNA nucleotidyltransferase [Bryobacterales bacterium]|nr:CCA tRNA nucleotidyltransferase [Bryobacterales bacterium]
MSDYMFMLESHLSSEQNHVVALMEAAAGQAGVQAFLSGGAMRDMLGGFPIRDLDFTIEGHSSRLLKILQNDGGARLLSSDGTNKSTELLFPNGVFAEVRSAHVARYTRPAAKPQIEPASIQEDLRQRDFTINSIALSLSRGSRGLLLDPTNGSSDLERRELRANSNYSLYDDPSRILRMFRLQTRMGFSLDPRLQQQYENVRLARLETKIPPKALLAELHRIAAEPNAVLLLETLEREKLLTLFSPTLQGQKLNLSTFSKLEKARQSIPFGVDFRVDDFGLFCYLLAEKLTPRERTALAEHLGMSKEEAESWQKLESRARKLEITVKSSRLNRASLVFRALRDEPGELILFLLLRSDQRLVTDRIKNFLLKYLPAASEVRDRDLAHLNLDPASPQFREARDELVFAVLDGRVRKSEPTADAEGSAVSAVAASTPERRSRSIQ